MAELVAQGKVRWAGVSNFDVALLERCEPIHHVDSLQPPFNAIQREAGGDCCRGASSTARGHRLQPDDVGPAHRSLQRASAWRDGANDWRRGFPCSASRRSARNLALRDALAPVAERHGASIAAVPWRGRWPGRA